MIISLVSQKGGVGKSALARLIAVEYAKAGWKVKIADLDTGQGTSTKWKMRRDKAGLQPDIAVEKFRSTERALQEAPQYDLLILDGPAHAEKGGAVHSRSDIRGAGRKTGNPPIKIRVLPGLGVNSGGAGAKRQADGGQHTG